MPITLFERIFARRARRFSQFPGPQPSFPLGNIRRFSGGRHPWQVCAEIGEQFGGVSLVWFFGKPALILNDPDAIGEVLESHSADYYKEAPCKALQPVITRQSLFISNLPEWRESRASHPLQTVPISEWLPMQMESIRNVIRVELDKWIEDSRPIDLYVEMQRLAFQAFAQAFWGRTLPAPFFDWFQALARMGDKRMKLPLPGPPLNPLFYRARRSWYDGFESFVAEARRAAKPDTWDLLNVSLRNGSPLSDASMAEALATNFFGGVFSCSSTINTALHLLTEHPDEKTKLMASLQEGLGIDGGMDALESCRRLDFVVREAMRFYPAVPIYFRNASKAQPVALGGKEIPPNTLLLISNWYLHKYSAHWVDPQSFRPDRWDDGVAEDNPLGSGFFFPFGRGPRMCIGAQFAMFYIKLALAAILLETDANMSPNQQYTQSFFFGVMMPKGLTATFAARPA